MHQCVFERLHLVTRSELTFEGHTIYIRSIRVGYFAVVDCEG